MIGQKYSNNDLDIFLSGSELERLSEKMQVSGIVRLPTKRERYTLEVNPDREKTRITFSRSREGVKAAIPTHALTALLESRSYVEYSPLRITLEIREK